MKNICCRIRSQRLSFLLVQFRQNASRNTEQVLVRFNQNDLQIESFQIYATGQSKMAVGCCY